MTIKAANQTTLQRLTEGQPFLVDCLPAAQAFGLARRTVLHAGPPLQWERACATVQSAICCAVRYEGWASGDAAPRTWFARAPSASAPATITARTGRC
jgi:hypothetical protein